MVLTQAATGHRLRNSSREVMSSDRLRNSSREVVSSDRTREMKPPLHTMVNAHRIHLQ